MPGPLVIVHHRNTAGPNESELSSGSLAAAVLDPKLLMDPNQMVDPNLMVVYNLHIGPGLCGPPSIRYVFVAWREHMILEFGAHKRKPDQSTYHSLQPRHGCRRRIGLPLKFFLCP